MAKKDRNTKTRTQSMLVLDGDAPDQELDFEVRYRLSLTVAQRFERMWSRSLQIAKRMAAHGHQKTPLIVERS